MAAAPPSEAAAQTRAQTRAQTGAQSGAQTGAQTGAETGVWTGELTAWLQGEAQRAGFERAGVAAAHAAEEAAGQLTAERFAGWIEQGRAGEMAYLARRNEAAELLRSSARAALPWARSIVVCAFSYNLAGADGSAAPRSIDQASSDQASSDQASSDRAGSDGAGDEAGWIARYAWTGDEAGGPLDYHDDLLVRLRVVEAALQARVPCETRCYVDTGPILERDFAARAGIGWIGKNTCVLNQQLGSWLLLGVIVTSLPLSDEAQAPAQPDRCGSCTRCIEACPTDALLRPGADGMRQMDASRCISYLTIEKKGAIAPELRAKMGRQVFGCDICQEVCPWNRRAPLAVPAGVKRREELINPSLAWLGGLDARGFKTLFKGSPVERTRLRRVQRNVAIAMGNSGRAEYRARLEAWAAEGADAVLQEAAQWALEQLGAAAEQQAASIEAAHTEQEEL